MATNGTQKLIRFLAKVAQDKELDKKMKSIKPGDSAAIIALAAAYGYYFTDQEFIKAVRETFLLVTSQNKELSELELDEVGGGRITNLRANANGLGASQSMIQTHTL